MQEIKHTFDFELFADTPEYRSVNSEIVRSWVELMVERGVKGIDCILDIATGAGTMVELFIEQLPAHWNQPVVNCLDQSMEALSSVEERLARRAVKLFLVHSPAEEMAIPERSIDIAVWGNGIHYLSEEAQKRSVMLIKQALKPGGLFFFNTSFYDGARPSETLMFYRAQVKKAVEFLRAGGIQRNQAEPRSEASRFLSKTYYEQLIVEASFKLEEVKEVTANLYRKAWEHISGFHQYAAGALHGYPIEEASIAMKDAVFPALEQYGKKDELGIPYIPRNWLAISASV